jgi:hypothetical protein
MQSLTANRLSDGAVVYRTTNGDWTRAIANAAVFDDDANAAEQHAIQDIARALVVGIELIDVTQGPNGPIPVSLREKIRAFGPTI